MTTARREFEEALTALCQECVDNVRHRREGSILASRTAVLSLFDAALAARPAPIDRDALANALRKVTGQATTQTLATAPETIRAWWLKKADEVIALLPPPPAPTEGDGVTGDNLNDAICAAWDVADLPLNRNVERAAIAIHTMRLHAGRPKPRP